MATVYHFKWIFISIVSVMMFLMMSLVYNCRIISLYSSKERPSEEEPESFLLGDRRERTVVLHRPAPQHGKAPPHPM
uniref:Transmembrane protein n=1 Tax=Steinernema glaseri TaxID=37863 RepID=A0A1I7YJT4_9BILA